MKFARASLIATLAAALFAAAAWLAAPAIERLTAPAVAVAAPEKRASATPSEAQRAAAIMDAYATKYDDLEGVDVVIGQTPGGEEAVAYYSANQIVIDQEHTVDIEKILAHEIWHIIDYRDNGRLDWGENLPPYNASDYRK